MTRVLLLCAIVLYGWPAAAFGEIPFYVSPSGNDGNPGTVSQPFLTLERARVAVRTVNQGMNEDVVVYLRGGFYPLSSTVVFDQNDSGFNGFNVVYRAYPGERPLLSGGRLITGWTAVGGGTYRANAGSVRFRQLYVNGVRAIRARQPNAGSYYQVRFWDIGGRRIEVASNEISNWQSLNQVEMVIIGGGVNQTNLRVQSFSPSGGSGALVTGMEPERTRLFQQTYPPKGPGLPFFFENAFELLDAPGEWYLNTSTNQVFYRPRAGEDMATAVAVAPQIETLVRLQGTLAAPVHHIQFRGINFEYSNWLRPNSEGFVGDQGCVIFTQVLPDDEISSYPGHRHPAAVHVEAATNIVFERNVLHHLGSSGINFYMAVQDSQFVGNVIADASACGVAVDLNLEGNPSDSRKISRRNVIKNNYITRTGRDYYQSVGIGVTYTDGSVIEHNELHDTSYSGISVGWGWDNVANAARDNLVRYNNIYDTNKLMSDGAGIYTLSRQPGTLLAENYVHDIVRTPSVQGGFNISGIYLDEGSSQITVRDNVLLNTADRKLFQNGNGPGNTLTNNDGSSSSVIANAGLEAAYRDIKSNYNVLPQSGPADTTPPAVPSGLRLNP
jgi:Right handed beta helix region